MLLGTANLAELGARAPKVERPAAEAAVLEGADVLQVLHEMPGDCREPFLPPGLHPTDPAVVSWLLYRCPSSPWGAFAMAQTRVECRSGLRLRAFLISAVVDNDDAAAALRDAWGFRVIRGAVTFRRNYDTVQAVVQVGGTTALDLVVADPDPLAPDDIQYVAGMHAAQTANGLRLLQVEPRYKVARAERGCARVEQFDGAAWGDARLRPVYPISAALALADITLSPVRFACRPDVLAFEGTEAIA